MDSPLRTKVCIIGSGPAAHTAAIYTARAELKPILFEGWMANDIAPGGQLPPQPTSRTSLDSQTASWAWSLWTAAAINSSALAPPSTLKPSTRLTFLRAVAKRLNFPGSGDGSGGFWNKGISACEVCDGAAPIFRDKPLAVIGGGDSAMEESTYLTKYASKVYIIHRRDTFRASKIMQSRAVSNPKIEVLWNSVVVEAYGDGERGVLGGREVKNLLTGEVSDLKVSGLFFAIGHEPATKFLEGQLQLDSDGYILTKPGTTQTSVRGVFAAGDVQDKKYRQAVTAAGTACLHDINWHGLHMLRSSRLRHGLDICLSFYITRKLENTCACRGGTGELFNLTLDS
ncbi:NADPH-dependent thioredoxin reductase A, putative [Theobroma cacao]|uniref:thioredoxin-disulfide reductase (NADPH) n=1 Tax=Theobroma cacao TaxID=3641 RepID=A0A061DFZ5_THECC|nr:NADPH-dependent thioredoxin reductase A, putative [Theobroma cacao]